MKEAPTIDAARAEAFAGRMLDILNHGALSLMVSLGHRTGLFDTMSGLPAATSRRIADAAGLDERYVREWLGAMVTGGIVEYEPDTQCYRLPPEHEACLTRRSATDNIAVFAQYVPLLGAVEDRILECFRKGGGLSYAEYGRFHEVMAEDSGQSVVGALVDGIVPLVPGLAGRLEAGIDVLDVGCGSGRALNLLARTFPASRFVGYDLCREAIDAAEFEALRNGTPNVRFERRDVAEMREVHRFDLITAFDAIHDQAAPDVVLRNIARALRPGGTFLMQDIAASSHVHENREHPIGPLLYTISCMHCMSVSLGRDGAGLGAMWGRQKALQMLAEAGFGAVEIRRLEHDVQNQFYVAAPAATDGGRPA